MSILQDLLADIAGFCAERGISESTFGRLAVNDGKIVGRIRDGKTITVATVDKVRAYIVAERQRAALAAASASTEPEAA